MRCVVWRSCPPCWHRQAKVCGRQTFSRSFGRSAARIPTSPCRPVRYCRGGAGPGIGACQRWSVAASHSSGRTGSTFWHGGWPVRRRLSNSWVSFRGHYGVRVDIAAVPRVRSRISARRWQLRGDFPSHTGWGWLMSFFPVPMRPAEQRIPRARSRRWWGRGPLVRFQPTSNTSIRTRSGWRAPVARNSGRVSQCQAGDAVSKRGVVRK